MLILLPTDFMYEISKSRVQRNSVIKANEENKNEAEKTRVLAALKQSKYALLKPEGRLTDKQKVKLEEVKKSLLADMHEQKEEFRKYLRPQKIGQMGHSNYWIG
jgi:transposase